jgi:acetyl-CoA carboxylase beta subunit
LWKRLSLEGYQMPPTAIIECPKCNGLLLSALDQKTKLCPYCGTRIETHKTKRIAYANDAFQASEILRQLKTKRQTNAHNPKK